MELVSAFNGAAFETHFQHYSSTWKSDTRLFWQWPILWILVLFLQVYERYSGVCMNKAAGVASGWEVRYEPWLKGQNRVSHQSACFPEECFWFFFEGCLKRFSGLMLFSASWCAHLRFLFCFRSLDFEECAHKLIKMDFPEGQTVRSPDYWTVLASDEYL